MIESIGLIAVAGTVAGGVLWLNKRQRRTEWQTLAKKLNLTVNRYSDATIIDGKLNNYSIIINGNNNAIFAAPVTVHMLLPFPPRSMTMFSENTRTLLIKLVKREDLDTGDHTFDRTVHVRGEERDCLALLNGNARQSVSSLMTRHEVTLQNGQFVLELQQIDAERIERALVAMSKTADDMNPGPCDTLELLAENSLNDPIPSVALRNFELLSEHYPDDEITRNTARVVIHKPYIPLSYMAASYLADEGLERLKLMTQVKGIDSEWRLKAFKKYGMARPHDTQLFLSLLEDSSCQKLQTKAAENLGKAGESSAVRDILKSALQLMKTNDNHELAATMVTAIGRLGGPKAEPAIHQIVGYKPESTEPTGRKLKLQLAVAVVRALYRIGTTASVMYLKRLSQGELAPRSSEVTDTANSAIKRIQRKIEHRSAGGLSIVEAQEAHGQISVVPDGGTLAMPPDDPHED